VSTITTLERLGGSVSLLAVTLLLVTYMLVRRARNVQNTFIVFASLSNVGASIGFMQSDPWWSLAMAINALLVFYFRVSPDSFRRRWWIYCLVCYGGPFVIALALLLWAGGGQERGPVYGDAEIWCWIDSRWDVLRIYTYYLCVWICITGSILCYLLVGCHVFRSRNRLHSFSLCRSLSAGKSREGEAEQDGGTFSVPGLMTPSPIDRAGPFYGTVTTEVQIMRTAVADDEVHLSPQRGHARDGHQHSHHHHHHPFQSSVSAVSATSPRGKTATPPGPLRRFATAAWSTACNLFVEDPVKRAYLRTSLLFALSVLATWIPSSLNRIYGLLAGRSPYPLHVATSAVLPLQGLWNALIFFISSWDAIRQEIKGNR
ncbi:hypothetical protein E4U41_003983, partial [Claviceps citrina]